jgi:hypothetical protein
MQIMKLSKRIERAVNNLIQAQIEFNDIGSLPSIIEEADEIARREKALPAAKKKFKALLNEVDKLEKE